MNNEQLFDLTSPPSAEFDTAQELEQLCSGNQKFKRREKYYNQM